MSLFSSFKKKKNCKKVNAEFVWSGKKKNPLLRKQDAILEVLLFPGQFLRVYWWISQGLSLGDPELSCSSRWSDSAVFNSPLYTRPLLTAENTECKMTLALKISHSVRHSVSYAARTGTGSSIIFPIFWVLSTDPNSNHCHPFSLLANCLISSFWVIFQI